MNRTKRSAASGDPWGTPLKISAQEEIISPNTILCFLFFRNASIHFRVKPDIPYALSFRINLLCGTVSNAFAKSSRTTSTGIPLSKQAFKIDFG